MVVSKDNHRRFITFPKKLEGQLEELAKKDVRSFNNLVIFILMKYVNEVNKSDSTK